MANLHQKQQPWADLTKEPIRRTVNVTVAVDGKDEYRTERVPSGRFFKVVKPSGSVVRMPLHNGRANVAQDDPYKLDKEFIKPRLGCIPYGQCPQTLPSEVRDGFLNLKAYGHNQPIIPPHLRDRPACTRAINGKAIGPANPCKCIEELITWRKAWQAARMAKAEVKTAADMQNEAAKGIVEAVKDMAETVKEMRQTSPALPPKKPGG